MRLQILWTSSRNLTAASASKAPFSTTPQRPAKQLSHQLTNPIRPSITWRMPPTAFSSLPFSRCHASTSSTTPSNEPAAEVLTWNRFFDLRRKRRYISLAASAVSALAAVIGLGPVIASQDIDSWGAQISGLDPMIVLGISTFAVAAGGWLCGPSFGNAGFQMWAARKGWAKAIVDKEKNFYRRIKTNRADPSASSPQNPIPDYYGEKIGSVKDYRRWLKDQRAFNRKKNKDLI
ncbi:presequence translocated-associated motor subunit PAM17 like protein [Teratosphaeria destructans]|uniref:Presequence translocated-associated motor subunit PAM17 n=1 Tax=Teratosphaeria destructans TaxID=418781 RepID=A0A9W7SK21_9PEZI|nr:presequence translocated-associated motor subunit PAM17 like protein [Teratosphaeria destructans]